MAAVRALVLAGGALTVTGGLALLVGYWIKAKRREEPQRSTLVSAQSEHGGRAPEDGDTAARSPTPDTPIPDTPTPGTPTPGAALPQAGGSQVLFLGLDGAGKTSLLRRLSTGGAESGTTPTQGLNAVSIHRGELHLELLEIGGRAELRDYWCMYLKRARVLVFVVDAADPSRFPLARTHLHQVLALDPSLPLVVLASKQDLPGACGLSQLFESLQLGSVGDARQLYILGTHVGNASETSSCRVQEAFDLIVGLTRS